MERNEDEEITIETISRDLFITAAEKVAMRRVLSEPKKKGRVERFIHALHEDMSKDEQYLFFKGVNAMEEMYQHFVNGMRQPFFEYVLDNWGKAFQCMLKFEEVDGNPDAKWDMQVMASLSQKDADDFLRIRDKIKKAEEKSAQ